MLYSCNKCYAEDIHSCQGMIRYLHNLYLHNLLDLQGSDIETLGSEASVEYGAELLEHPPVGETQLQDIQASASAGKDPFFFFFFRFTNKNQQ